MAIADKERLALGVRRWYGRIWDFARRKPLGAAGATFIIVMGVAAIFADLSPYGPLQQDLDRIREGPTFAHPFGTDELGRDLLTRVIFGARVTFKIGFLGILIGATAGATIGVVSGYFRGKLDMVLQRVVDAVMAFPALILALALISIREPSDVNTLIIIGIVFTPTSSRVVRGATMSVKQNVLHRSIQGPGSRRPSHHLSARCTQHRRPHHRAGFSLLGLRHQRGGLPVLPWGRRLHRKTHMGRHDRRPREVLPGDCLVAGRLPRPRPSRRYLLPKPLRRRAQRRSRSTASRRRRRPRIPGLRRLGTVKKRGLRQSKDSATPLRAETTARF